MLARVLCQAKAQGSIAEVEGGLECPLCMEVIVRAVGLPCDGNHTMCLSCWVNWATKCFSSKATAAPTCPECRQDVTANAQRLRWCDRFVERLVRGPEKAEYEQRKLAAAEYEPTLAELNARIAGLDSAGAGAGASGASASGPARNAGAAQGNGGSGSGSGSGTGGAGGANGPQRDGVGVAYRASDEDAVPLHLVPEGMTGVTALVMLEGGDYPFRVRRAGDTWIIHATDHDALRVDDQLVRAVAAVARRGGVPDSLG